MLATRTGQRLTINQLRQLLREGGVDSHAQGWAVLPAGSAEVEEAVRELEAEGVLQYVPRTQTAIIRGGN